MLSETRSPRLEDFLLQFLYRLDSLETNQKEMHSHSKRLQEMLETLSKGRENVGVVLQPELAEQTHYQKSLVKRMAQLAGIELGFAKEVAKASTFELLEKRLQQVEKMRLGSTDEFVKASALERLEERLTQLEEAKKQQKLDEPTANLLAVNTSHQEGQQQVHAVEVRLDKLEEELRQAKALRVAELTEIQAWRVEVDARLAPQPDSKKDDKDDFAADRPEADSDQDDPKVARAHDRSGRDIDQQREAVIDSVPSGSAQSLASECVTAKDVQSYRDLSNSVSALDTSVWDAMFFFGIPGLTTIRGQILLVQGWAISFLLQIGTVYVVSMHMIINPYDEPVLDELRRWKECGNNAEQRLDSNSGCTDVHLDVQTMWTEVDSFFTADLPYPAGWVMSILATAMWVSVIAVEFRDILRMLKVVWFMPKGVCTRIMANDSNYTLVEVHGTRKWVMFFMAVARFVIAFYLLHSGTMFLTYTSDIEALIMNAVALAFVIEIDNIIFNLSAPSSVIHLIGNLNTLPVADPVGQDIDVCILLFFVLVYIAVIDSVFLRPFVHSMEDVIEIINW